MANSSLTAVDFSENPPRVSEWKRFSRIFFQRKLVIVGMVLVFIFVFIAIFGTWLAPYDPYQPDVNNRLAQPSKAHWLGTDAIGRDTLSRLFYGARTALTIGFLTVIIGTSIGIILGMVAGYFGRAVSMIIMRFVDALMTFPMLLLALLIASLLGGGIQNVIIALTVGTIAPYARIVNGQTLSAKENDYVMASHSIGASDTRVISSPYISQCCSDLHCFGDNAIRYVNTGRSRSELPWDWHKTARGSLGRYDQRRLQILVNQSGPVFRTRNLHYAGSIWLHDGWRRVARCAEIPDLEVPFS